MAMFRPIIILGRGGREFTIANLAEALAIMEKFAWADDAGPVAAQAYRLVCEAIDGRCAPRKAFAAFVQAARDLGVAKDLPRSPAWDEFEAKINRRDLE